MILGTGIDLLEIERIKKAAGNEHFLRRVFTQDELCYVRSRGERPETFAGIFCAKEAVAKALGTGFSSFRLTDIEIAHDAFGAPKVILHGGAAKRMQSINGSALHISVTHDKTTAAAYAILEGEPC